MRLFIAEKPSLGRAIADVLGSGQNKKSHIICNDDIVTWCFGHLFRPYNPEEYDPELKKWNKSSLPIIPQIWKNKVREGVHEQVNTIGTLLKQSSVVINAGDPDREGQLLVDEVLEHFNFKGQVMRIWLASLDNVSVKKALDNLADNKKYKALCDSAKARARADWLIGMNATRAMTLKGQENGFDGVLSLGRVQTPTLNLVVLRDKEIADFKPKDYFTIQAELEHGIAIFKAVFQPSETQAGLDADKRLTDKNIALKISGAIKGQTAKILEYKQEPKQKSAPLPHCLSSLQKMASDKFGLTAQQVLDTAQSLYEKKLTTYPRTDCRYLPEEQFSGSGKILKALSTYQPIAAYTSKANPDFCSSAWNTKKITAHHAIIPTGELPANLSKDEQIIFNLVAMGFCLQFFVPFKYEAQKITLSLVDYIFVAHGRIIQEYGWTKIQMAEDDEEAIALPLVKAGDRVVCKSVNMEQKQTTPPGRFTEGGLIEAMANVHRFVNVVEAKSILKENEGIGTEATRAGIIETLKKRGFLATSKKALVSTPLAQKLINITPEELKSPITTAMWEKRLTAIAQSQDSLDAFMQDQVKVLPEILNPILGAKTESMAKETFLCPKCKEPLKSIKTKNGLCFACFNDKVHSKPEFFENRKGKPVFEKKKK